MDTTEAAHSSGGMVVALPGASGATGTAACGVGMDPTGSGGAAAGGGVPITLPDDVSNEVTSQDRILLYATRCLFLNTSHPSFLIHFILLVYLQL